MKIKGHFVIQNWRLVSRANMRRIVVRGTKDVSQTIRGYEFSESYRELYVVVHEPEGFIWREITHAMGINGHHGTLRDLIRSTALLGFEIEVLSELLDDEIIASVKQKVEEHEKHGRS